MNLRIFLASVVLRLAQSQEMSIMCAASIATCLYNDPAPVGEGSKAKAQGYCRDKVEKGRLLELFSTEMEQMLDRYMKHYKMTNAILNAELRNGSWTWQGSNANVANVDEYIIIGNELIWGKQTDGDIYAVCSVDCTSQDVHLCFPNITFDDEADTSTSKRTQTSADKATVTGEPTIREAPGGTQAPRASPVATKAETEARIGIIQATFAKASDEGGTEAAESSSDSAEVNKTSSDVGFFGSPFFWVIVLIPILGIIAVVIVEVILYTKSKKVDISDEEE